MTAFGIYFLLILIAVAAAGGGLLWALRRAKEDGDSDMPEPFDIVGGHVIYLPQMRQAMQRDDLRFLTARRPGRLVSRVRRERTRVVLLYLKAMRSDFRRLIRLARVIAALSPEIAPAREWEQLRLSLRFSVNYALVKTRLMLGMAAMTQLNGLSCSVSELTIRIETAMTELGERAALASEMASASRS